MNLLRRLLAAPTARLAAFAVVLALALGAGALVGATIGPDAPATEAPADHDEHGG